MSAFEIPETAADALAAWDKGEIVHTVEMGGLGPGYEQAIHVLVFELIRDCGDAPLPAAGDKEAWYSWGEATVSRIDAQCRGFSGAQVGAAQNLAARALKIGWRAMLNEVPTDRRTMVSRAWPNVPLPESTR